MTEVPQAQKERTLGNRLAATVLVLLMPILLLAIVGVLAGGGAGIGPVEITLVLLIWTVGLTWVWRPRRA